MDIGYWQLVAEEEARERLALLTPDGKQGWKVMHMGALNVAPTSVAMMMKLHMEWDTLAKERGFISHQELLLIMCYCMGTHPGSF